VVLFVCLGGVLGTRVGCGGECGLDLVCGRGWVVGGVGWGWVGGCLSVGGEGVVGGGGWGGGCVWGCGVVVRCVGGGL